MGAGVLLWCASMVMVRRKRLLESQHDRRIARLVNS